MLFHEKLNAVTYLIVYCDFLDLFYGTLGIKWGSKWQKFVHLFETSVLNFSDVSMLKCNSDTNIRGTQQLTRLR